MAEYPGPILVRGGPREGLYFRDKVSLNRLTSDPRLSRDVSMPAAKSLPLTYRGLALYIADPEDWALLQVALTLDEFKRR